MEKQSDKFLSYENFYIAFKRLQTVDGFSLYKNLYRPDLNFFGFYLEENINLLIHNIKEDIYEPQFSLKIYIPKKNNLVRPLSLLDFIDLLVYQALVNIVADVVYDEMSLLHNKTIFGNIFNKSDSESGIFFFKKWKTQWKKYNDVTESYFNEGYSYFTDFDIASFFDTINHDILIRVLNEKGVDGSITSLLKKCLSKWSIAQNRNNYGLSQGLPQGPIGSSLLADIYLLPIDEKVTSNRNLSIKYQRYVDDIRILSKSELEGKKVIAYLDLIARDFGLIPQSSKISTRKIENIKRELNIQHSRFSDIANEFQRNRKQLKKSTHNKQKKQFLNCFISENNEDFLNKTIIRFSLFKLNKDDEIKNAILSNIHSLYPHFEAVLYYFFRHYSTDNAVIKMLEELIKGDNLLFQHIIALIYKEFSHIPYNEELFLKHFENNNRFWLIKYFILDWLLNNKEIELINHLDNSDIYYINRKLLNYKFQLSNSEQAQKKLLRTAMGSDNALLSMQALYLHVNEYLKMPPQSDNYNLFVKNITADSRLNYISYTLEHKYNISNSTSFFNDESWDDKRNLEELKTNFLLFNKHLEIDPSIALMSLNIFNEQVFYQILHLLDKPLSPGADYGGSIESIKEALPYSAFYFDKINQARNQKTYAHYKDKEGNIRIKITFSQLNKLLISSNFHKAFTEICSHEVLNKQIETTAV